MFSFDIFILQTIESAQSTVVTSTLKPTLTFIGNPINVCYFWVADKKFTFGCPFVAFESCFLLYLALNLKYPEESQHVWTFVQNGIFNVKTQYDIILPSIISLINDLKHNIT